MPSVCVIGGGPAGATFAARMAQLGHDVTLIERARFPRERLGESLTPGVMPMLEATGARDALEDCGFHRVRRVHVDWDDGPRVREDPREQGLLVDRGRFDAVLLERARALGVRVLQPAAVRARRREAEGWRLEVDAEGEAHVLRADLIADATGRAAGLTSRRRRTGCRTAALYAYWRAGRLPEEPRIEAGEHAWYWGVPLPNGTYNTLVFVDVKRLRGQGSTDLTQCLHALLAASGLMTDCRDARMSGRVRVADATPYLDQDSVGADTIRLGDAALAIDPISSSGVQKALQTALAGAIVANTVLRKPASREAAFRFHRENLLDASERHRRWAAGHYRSVAEHRESAFWSERARLAVPEAAPVAPGAFDPRTAALHRVRLSPAARFVERPCLDETFVTLKRALEHPALEAPVAYLGGFELAPLLESLGAAATPVEIARSWSGRMPRESAVAITRWLLDNRILVQDSESAVSEVTA